MPKSRQQRPAKNRERRARTRYLFVCGGVLSGVGKGTTVAALGRLLIAKGYRVTAMKIDPYLNVDAGTMNPTEHGEVFVTGDGLETDQDLGNYERFLDLTTTRLNYMTTGQVYLEVIKQERNLHYNGRCVETVPHIPDEVIRRMLALARSSRAEIVIVEIGGTVGEYQNLVYLEAARMLKLRNPDEVQFLMVSYMPIPETLGEMKTKPTQHAVQRLNSAGIQPDFLICRGAESLDQRRKEKISLMCTIRPDHVVSDPDAKSVYEVPLIFEREKLAEKLLAGFRLRPRQSKLADWKHLVRSSQKSAKTMRIAMVGKYFASGAFTFADSYVSVIEAVKHAAWKAGCKPENSWIDAERFEHDPQSLKELDSYDGIIVPGGFGSRGTDGILAAIGHARLRNIPYFGLCYGMQLAVVEFCRSVLRLKGAHTTEVDAATKHPVIDIMREQKEVLRNLQFGGTMRLGNYRCTLRPGSIAAAAYKDRSIIERHRHRYELNNAFVKRMERAGMTVSGKNPQTHLAEIVELRGHPFFVGVQFHPEFLSRPMQPHPLFSAFLHACSIRHEQRNRP